MAKEETGNPITNDNNPKTEEWKNLREEISRKQQLNYRILFSTIGLNFLLYSYLLVEKGNHEWMDAFIALLPAFFVGIAHYWHLKNEHSALRIALYIRHFIEIPESNSFNWETTLHDFINVAIKEKRAFKTSFLNKLRREVYLLLHPFYFLSPLISSLIFLHVEAPPEWLSPFNFSFGLTFMGFLSISLLIMFIWQILLIRVGQREIQILNDVSKDISTKGIVPWKTAVSERSYLKEKEHNVAITQKIPVKDSNKPTSSL